MKISIVDIGSNAVKYKIFNSENFELLEYYREPLRLGRDVFTNGALSKSTINELIILLDKYSNIFEKMNIKHSHYIATSAVRDSKNSNFLVMKLNEMNINLKILSGKQEASLLEDFNKDIEESAVIDIGGGSVEVCVNKNSKMYFESFQLGAVRLLNLDPTSKEQTLKEFSEWLSRFKPIPTTYGLGGNLRAIMEANNHKGIIDRQNLVEFINTYKSIDEKTLKEKYAIPADRIDIVPVAAEIYLLFLAAIGAKTIENSFWSISDGLIKKVVKGEL